MKVEPLYQRFGLRIRSIAGRRGMTQERVAKIVGLSRGSIANIELGNQRILLNDVIRFSKAFGMTPAELMRGVW